MHSAAASRTVPWAMRTKDPYKNAFEVGAARWEAGAAKDHRNVAATTAAIVGRSLDLSNPAIAGSLGCAYSFCDEQRRA